MGYIRKCDYVHLWTSEWIAREFMMMNRRAGLMAHGSVLTWRMCGHGHKQIEETIATYALLVLTNKIDKRLLLHQYADGISAAVSGGGEEYK